MDRELDPAAYLACPHCDTLHHARHLAATERARCARCGTLLVAPHVRSFIHVIALSATAMVLMVAAVFFPFLAIDAQGFRNATSVFEAAMAFSDGLLLPLSIVVLGMIVALPAIRFAALIYVLWPLTRGAPAYRHARTVFRVTEQMQPWSMAEIFVIGTAVALVKVAGLAHVSLGPAFWAFCALIIVTALKNSYMSSWTIWDAIATNRRS